MAGKNDAWKYAHLDTTEDSMDTNDLIAARTRAEYGVDELRAENERLRRFVDFVNLWCNREGKISDSERLSAIKHHPTAQAAMIRAPGRG